MTDAQFTDLMKTIELVAVLTRSGTPRRGGYALSADVGHVIESLTAALTPEAK